MECEVSLGAARRFDLRGAILIYGGGPSGSRAFAAWHEAHAHADGAPSLGPANPLSTGFLRELARGLGAMAKPEILADNVLVRTPETLIWWTRACRQRLFFRQADALGAVNGRTFPLPPLIFKVTGRELWIRALATNRRPGESTPLHVAPFYNVDASGSVCQGSMRSPGEASAASIGQWERAFFESEFTHIYGAGHFTRHSGGLVGLWTELADTSRFPPAALVPADETLGQFAERDR